MERQAQVALDAITREVCETVNAPVALVTVLGHEHQHFASVQGLPEPWRSRRCTPLAMSFCRHVVLGRRPLEVEHAPTDPRFRDHAAVEALNVVAYLGVPLLTPSGEAAGALCAIDVALRRWSAADRAALTALARRISERDLEETLGGRSAPA
jgi:GAF domain-containing protein